MILSRVWFPKEFGCYWVAYEESMTLRGIFFVFKDKYIGIISVGTLSAVYGMDQSGGEIGGKNNTQMTRMVVDKQEGYSVLFLKEDEEYGTGSMLVYASMKGEGGEGYNNNSSPWGCFVIEGGF